MNYLKIVPETITDGDGLRTAIYVAGCENYCKGCFNPESWDYSAGKPLTDEVIDNIITDFNTNTLIEGISVLGGDPFAPKNREDFLDFLKKLRLGGIPNLWAWTGYTLEVLQEEKTARECLKYIDTLVDGPYIESLRDAELAFRGSGNQRIIHLQSIKYAPSKPSRSSLNLLRASGVTITRA